MNGTSKQAMPKTKQSQVEERGKLKPCHLNFNSIQFQELKFWTENSKTRAKQNTQPRFEQTREKGAKRDRGLGK